MENLNSFKRSILAWWMRNILEIRSSAIFAILGLTIIFLLLFLISSSRFLKSNLIQISEPFQFFYWFITLSDFILFGAFFYAAATTMILGRHQTPHSFLFNFFNPHPMVFSITILPLILFILSLIFVVVLALTAQIIPTELPLQYIVFFIATPFIPLVIWALIRFLAAPQLLFLEICKQVLLDKKSPSYEKLVNH
jgi:hypothetical protein